MRLTQIHKRAQIDRLKRAIDLAGPRYSPRLNVAVSIASVFEGLGRTRAFYDQLKRPGNELLKNLRSVKVEEIAKFANKEFAVLKEVCLELANLLLSIPNSGVAKIDFVRIGRLAEDARSAASVCNRLLQAAEVGERKKRELEQPRSKSGKKVPSQGTYDEAFRNERHYLYEVAGNLSSILEFSKSDAAQAANNPRLLLTGIAGSGKTHFLCDLAKRRIHLGLPTLIFLGEEFTTKNPFDTVRTFLDITLREESFLAELNRYAASKGMRALLIVDATNESASKPAWSRFNRIRNYENIGIVLSVRSGFEKSELQPSVLNSFIHLEHQGFATREWSAVTKFFAEYKLPLPEVPILFPEFRIPLFLKIFCESFAGAKQPLKGHYGFTHIFEQYVKRQGMALLKRLSEPANIGESRARIWDGTIKEIAICMGESGTDRIVQTKAISIAAKQFPGRGRQALGMMEKYWLLTKVPRYRNAKLIGFDYRFPYQKFSDHLIVRNLLSKHLDIQAPTQSFRRGSKLREIIDAVWLNRGLIEALSIQIPERLKGRELVHIAPASFRREDVAKDSFLESLVWRDLSLKKGKPKYIKAKRVLSFLNNHVLPFVGGNDKIIETILTVSAIPNHPLNANLLHRHLKKMKLPIRDAYWLPFINGRDDDENAASRLVAWAWDGGDKTRIAPDSLRLAGTTLAWFLASSNRRLRDRSTKALVSMLSGRLSILLSLLRDFEDVDDPYVIERLYAVAYGCAMQPGNTREDISRLASYVYKRIFGNENPPLHVLLRDYARGVVELGLAQAKELKSEIDVAKLHPPHSSGSLDNPPSLKSLRRRYYPKRKSYKHGPNDYWAIWNSLMHDNEGGLSDFGNYVVNSALGHWCNVRLRPGGGRPKLPKELEREFISGLTVSQSAEWKKIGDLRASSAMGFFTRRASSGKNSDQPVFSMKNDGEAEAAAKELEKSFVAALSRKMRTLYKRGVLVCRRNPRGSDDLDYAAMQRHIFKRVVQLGWTPALHGKYDSGLRDHDRSSPRVERIGKKYQWIAFHEVLGAVADSFVFRGYWSDDPVPFIGPFQIFRRDIDPSCLVRSKPRGEVSGRVVRDVYKYASWRPSVGDSAWTEIRSDLPDVLKLVQLGPSGEWLVLDGHSRWEQPPLPGREKFESTRRDVWYTVDSYLVKRNRGRATYNWARKQNFMGRWMPDSLEVRSLFLREIPDSLAYRTEHSSKSLWADVNDRRREATGLRLLPTVQGYGWEGGVDASVDDGLNVKIPSIEILERMRLRHSAKVGEFVNEGGEIIAVDPSVQEGGASKLLVKKEPFLKFLRDSDYEVLWVVVGEKLLIGGNMSGRDFPGRLEMGGAIWINAAGRIQRSAYTNHLPAKVTR